MPPDDPDILLARLAAARRLLVDHGWSLTPPPPPAPPLRCAVETCKRNEHEAYVAFGYELLPITVSVGEENEEGWQAEVRWFCGEHFQAVVADLLNMGFGSHRHGSTNFLEIPRKEDDPFDVPVPTCVGYDGCPTPSRKRFHEFRGGDYDPSDNDDD